MSHCFIHGATESEGLSVRDVSKARFWGQRGAQAAVAAPRSFRRCTGAVPDALLSDDAGLHNLQRPRGTTGPNVESLCSQPGTLTTPVFPSSQ